jgi:hypothetical protein
VAPSACAEMRHQFRAFDGWHAALPPLQVSHFRETERLAEHITFDALAEVFELRRRFETNTEETQIIIRWLAIFNRHNFDTNTIDLFILS